MNWIEILDRIKKENNLSSDYKLAKFLGVDYSTIFRYRNGERKHPSGEVIEKIMAKGVKIDR